MALTKVSTPAIKDEAITLAKLLHGDSNSNGKFLRANNGADPTFETVTSTTINNNADNRLITGSGTANTLNAEQYLTYTSQSSLNLTDGVGTSNLGGNYLLLKRASGNTNYLNAPLADAELYISADEAIRFATVHTADFNSTERMRITSTGQIGIGLTNPDVGNSAYKVVQVHSSSSNAYFKLSNDTTGSGSGDGVELSLSGSDAFLTNRESASLIFRTAATERMRIDSSGNVGIGTASPSVPSGTALEIYDSSTSRLKLSNNTTGTGSTDGFQIYMTGSSAILENKEDAEMRFYTNASERMRIDAGGRLLIGTTSYPDGSADGIALKAANGERAFSRGHTGTRYQLVFYNPNGMVGRIETGGSSTSYLTSSDYRLKENATAISDGITRLKTLKPYRFNFKADASKTLDGFFAHEVTAVPEAVSGTKDEVDSNNKPVYQGIDQAKLVPLLTAALQEEVAKREALETRVAALEAA
jgi:hypothetical protein